MAKVSTNITIDSDTKAKAQELFADFGLDLSTAINIFLRQAIRENAIPFPISRKTPSDGTPMKKDETEAESRRPQNGEQ
ncbi:MAG: type II toxin-antitoxin system RelB/DinJ family antitoxin [Clostridia bacterium]|nr:type II toxin-antitoxin system RelB/DinJ family antitoxin [Clostridia bacterium]